jgi:hypothetical protein
MYLHDGFLNINDTVSVGTNPALLVESRFNVDQIAEFKGGGEATEGYIRVHC